MRQRATAAALILHSAASFAGRRRASHHSARSGGDHIFHMEELLIMDYPKEYASLVGQIDRAISILENYAPGDPIVWKAVELLLCALRVAEEHYLEA